MLVRFSRNRAGPPPAEEMLRFRLVVVLQAWKQWQSNARLDELAEKFEDIEHQEFGKDGSTYAPSRASPGSSRGAEWAIPIAIPYRLRRTDNVDRNLAEM